MDNNEIRIRERVTEAYRALTSKDRKTMECLLHEQFVYLTPWGKMFTKQEFLHEVFDRTESCQLVEEPKFLSMQTIDPIARTVFLRLRGQIVIGGRRIRGSFRASHTLVNTHGEWLFLAVHLDAMR